MIIKKMKNMFILLLIITIPLIFMGGDCATDSGEDPTQRGVAGPIAVNVMIDTDNPGDSSYAVVSWQHSPDRDRQEFDGYQVFTNVLDEQNQAVANLPTKFASEDQVSVRIENIDHDQKYQSFVKAYLTTGEGSDSITTKIYSGVYYYIDGAIDEYTETEPTMSGFGWDLENGAGAQYNFNQSNAPLIDLHLRSINGNLYFISPNETGLTNSQNTMFLNIGTGEDAFDMQDLQEPVNDSSEVMVDNVYLLKLEDDYYVKIWVKSIQEVISTPPFRTVEFEYKVQTVEGLRIVKR